MTNDVSIYFQKNYTLKEIHRQLHSFYSVILFRAISGENRDDPVQSELEDKCVKEPSQCRKYLLIHPWILPLCCMMSTMQFKSYDTDPPYTGESINASLDVSLCGHNAIQYHCGWADRIVYAMIPTNITLEEISMHH